ncbi:MAG TPA: hypothetical protein VG821_10440 [Rhizomicrobium sp.]|nr:hypothetical protein [Rhizomicrobium sp.]
MDRTAVRDLVEDYYRTLIPAMQTGGISAFNDVSSRFEERIRQTAALMPPLESASFSQIVDAERERLMADYQTDPIALKRRLGISLGVDAPHARTSYGSSGGDLGNLVVRTAVRATIWESIWALFRVFR